MTREWQSVRTVEDLLTVAASDDREVWYLILPGNAGDSLISVGFFDIAERVGLTYQSTTNPSDIPHGALVLVNGGGGLVPEWQAPVAERILAASRRSSGLVLLPSSVRGCESFLAALPAGTILFLRERPSYEHARANVASGITCLLDHDMAFHVDVDRLLAHQEAQGSRAPRNAKDWVRYGLYMQARARGRYQKTIRAFRHDRESAKNPGRSAILNDLSVLAFFGGSNEAECRLTSARFAGAIERFDTIITDRLHTAILSALLNKNVEMHEGSYYKLGGVYEQSLKDNVKVTYEP